MFQLCHGNDDGQAIDEAQHHGVRHHAHQLAQLEQTEQGHDQAGQQHGGQQVLHPVLHHQRHDDDGHGACCTRDHARASAEQGGEGADDESAVQTHQGMQMRDQRERNALGRQGKSGGDPGQHIGAKVSEIHVGTHQAKRWRPNGRRGAMLQAQTWPLIAPALPAGLASQAVNCSAGKGRA